MSARILVFDIERLPMFTKPLPVWDMRGLINHRLHPDEIQSWGRTICLAYRWWGDRPMGFIAEWQKGGRTGFLTAARDLLEEADVLVGHNMGPFDYPHLKGEFLLEDIDQPSPSKVFDTLQVARRNGNLENNQLDTLDKRFGFRGKTDKYRIQVAVDAAAGDEKMQKKIQRYNEGDIRATERVYRRLRPLGTVNLAVFSDGERCTACESTRIKPRGMAYTNVGTYQRYRCDACGKWMRGRSAIKRDTEMRPAS